MRRRLQEGMDILIVNPQEAERASTWSRSRRSSFTKSRTRSTWCIRPDATWRLGQTEPVPVYYPVYRDTMEHRAVARVGQKLAAAQMLYGNDIAGGLIAAAHAGRGLLDELMRDVLNHAVIPDLSELGRAEQAAEQSGWLLGSGGRAEPGSTDASEAGREPAPRPLRGVQSLLV